MRDEAISRVVVLEKRVEALEEWANTQDARISSIVATHEKLVSVASQFDLVIRSVDKRLTELAKHLGLEVSDG